MPSEKVETFAQRAAEVAEKTEKFDQAVARMSVEFTKNLYEDIQQSKDELARLTKNANAKFGEFAPGTTKLRGALEDCFKRVESIFKDKGGLTEMDASEEEGLLGVNGQPQGSASGPLRSREDAFRRLAEVAAFLRQKEPQSPIYLLVERAVAWSRMPFDQLLGEMIKDASARGQVGELLGIKPPPDAG